MTFRNSDRFPSCSYGFIIGCTHIEYGLDGEAVDFNATEPAHHDNAIRRSHLLHLLHRFYATYIRVGYIVHTNTFRYLHCNSLLQVGLVYV